MLFGLLPLLFGLLFQQIVINPITCNHDQTPLVSFWQVWALGVLHTKITTALILTGPQWWLRQAVDRVNIYDFFSRLLGFYFSDLS
jgi:E3 ubiquitin-protein ligase MARCH6